MPTRSLSPGSRLFDRYELIQRLSSGRSVEVWRARDLRGGIDVALKVLGDAGRADELEAEWRLARRLTHPHIVRVFEYHDAPGDGKPACYAMQYVEGVELGALGGRRDEDGRPAWGGPFALLLEAVAYLHGRDLVHRDIKASNVLVDLNGAPYLTDFGVAAAPPEAGGGTRAAMSPEQAAGEPPARADDVYALGVLLHELATGRPPAENGPDREALDAAVSGPSGPGLGALVAEMLGPAAERPGVAGVAGRLASLGIAARPAPRGLMRELAGPGAGVGFEEPIETIVPAARRRAGQAAPPEAAVDSRSGGVSPLAVGGGLALLLALAVWVLVFLPRSLAPGDPAPEAPVAVETAPETAPEESPDTLEGDEIGFTENVRDDSRRSDEVRAKRAADDVLGELLTKLDVLELRGVQRWGESIFAEAQADYAAGDRAYLARDYARARERYQAASERLDILIDKVENVFARAMAAGEAAIEAGDSAGAKREYELALAVTPDHPDALHGLERANNLDEVLALTDEALAAETRGELETARDTFEQALALDAAWQPAQAGLARVQAALADLAFQNAMSQGFAALAQDDYGPARRAFERARTIRPGSREPLDGLQQLDQAERLAAIERLQARAARQERDEDWRGAVKSYEAILEQDPNVALAKEGLARARSRVRLDETLEGYLAEPDSLSAPATMEAATTLLTRIAALTPQGPRLTAQKRALAAALKRAATPLEVTLISDNATRVLVYKVGWLGTFETTTLALRPGTYTAVGTREGYRDVRREFRVAPEIELAPVVVRCEEPI